ncbi:MAG: hypothetical protein EPN22_03855 [Nitrospirae bacterium]|nr:MAG: hypothetical protein EPN22_03855 [Nitrospirota bacterium]
MDVDDDISTTSLTVIYDTEKTDIETIKKALKDATYPVEGDPVEVK